MRDGSVQDSDKQLPAVPEMSFNDWLNSGRTIDTTAADRLRESGLYGTINEDPFIYAQNLRVVCRDGYHVSIQASAYHYSTPRKTLADISEYSAFELGFPSMPDELLREFADSAQDDLTKTVYAYVPRALVELVLANHGGIVSIGTRKIPIIGTIE